MGLRVPAIEGGAPVRSAPLPYARQCLGAEEAEAAARVLGSGWITCGPETQRFEKLIAERVRANHAVAVTSCTAALHLALDCLGVGAGDEVILPPLTFAATALAVMYTGAKPVLADIDGETLNIDPESIESKITNKTRALLPVHYGGNPCDMNTINEIARTKILHVVEDAAHAIGAEYGGAPVGADSGAACFSFHAVKNMTTAEGGAIATRDDDFAARLVTRRFFGIAADAWKRESSGKPWEYDVEEYGFKYNPTDIQSAIGSVQIGKLDGFLARRREIAAMYDKAFGAMDEFSLLKETPGAKSAMHLYVVRLKPGALRVERDHVVAALRAEGISANIHYKPLHRHTFFAKALGVPAGGLPVCDAAAEEIITLPLFPDMSDDDTMSVIEAAGGIAAYYRK